MRVKLNVNQKMSGGIGLVALMAAVASLVAMWIAFALSQALETRGELNTLIMRQLHADMMHDALRGDVLMALAAADPAMKVTIADVRKDLAEHAEGFRAALAAMTDYRGDPEVERAVAAVAAPLAAYIESAEKIVNVAATQPQAAKGLLGEFGLRFSTLESSMANLSGLLESIGEKRAAQAVSTTHLSFALVLVTLIGGIAMSATLLVILRRQVLTPLSGVTAALGKLSGGDLDVMPPATDRDDEIGLIARR